MELWGGGLAIWKLWTPMLGDGAMIHGGESLLQVPLIWWELQKLKNYWILWKT